MESFKLYFNTFKCDKKTPYTHTSIGKPSCSLSVPDDKLEEFYLNYHRAMVQGMPLHLTEKPNGEPDLLPAHEKAQAAIVGPLSCPIPLYDRRFLNRPTLP